MVIDFDETPALLERVRPNDQRGSLTPPRASRATPGRCGAEPHGLEAGTLPAPTISHRDGCLEALHELLPR